MSAAKLALLWVIALIAPGYYAWSHSDFTLMMATIYFTGALAVLFVAAAFLMRNKKHEKAIEALPRIPSDANQATKALFLLKECLHYRQEGLIIVDDQQCIIDCNQRAVDLFGLQAPKIGTETIQAWLEPLPTLVTNPDALQTLLDCWDDIPGKEHAIDWIFKDDKRITASVIAIHLSETQTGKVVLVRDTTTDHAKKVTLSQQLYSDTLTGLANRALFQDRLAQAVRYSREGHRFLSVFVIDLDRFKNFNDRYGLVMGDKVLKLVAERLQHLVTSDDTLARLHADQFAIVCVSKNGEMSATELARNILAQISETINIEGNAFNISASLGIGFYPKDGDDAETLFKHADIALGRARDQGGNQFEFFTKALSNEYKERLMVENHLRNALRYNEFTLLYQPIVSNSTHRIVGVEVLLRWMHPIMGAVSPLVFLPIAEQNGMIKAIGEWILRTGCEQLRCWHKTTDRELFISFNLSERQYTDPQFTNNLLAICRETELHPRHVTLELTETVVMKDIDESIKTLSSLKATGVKLALDDFGTGLSCLNYLSRLPIDIIKIDNMFVQGLPEDDEAKKMIASIIALAQQMQFDVIAEGVSTLPQQEFLSTHQCDIMQGYHFYQPMQAEILGRHLAHTQKTDALA